MMTIMSPHSQVSKMTVKVHYSTTRAIRVSTSISFKQLESLICKKFDQEDDSLTLCCKNNIGELIEISDEATLKEACHSLDDGFRLTMWAYDKHEVDFIQIFNELTPTVYTTNNMQINADN